MFRWLRRKRKAKASELDGVRFSYAGANFDFPYPSRPDHIYRRMVASGGFYELNLLEALRTTLKGVSGLALDCGANIGNHTIYFAKVMGLKTFAFEPVPQNVDILRKVVTQNEAHDLVEIVPLALGAANGSVQLSSPQPENPGMFRVSTGPDGVSAECVTIDSFLAARSIPPDTVKLIKIDVEGYECEVLRGALATIAASDALLVAEFAEKRLFDEFREVAGGFGYVPQGVYCATPTVIFSKSTGHDVTVEILRRIEIVERKTRGGA